MIEIIQSRLKQSQVPVATDFNIVTWLSNNLNVVIQLQSDFGLFEYIQPGVFSAHYLFESRGKDAKDASIEMLNQMYYNNGANVIVGLIPVDNRKAQIMTSALGFKRGRIINNWAGECVPYFQTKTEFSKRYI